MCFPKGARILSMKGPSYLSHSTARNTEQRSCHVSRKTSGAVLLTMWELRVQYGLNSARNAQVSQKVCWEEYVQKVETWLSSCRKLSRAAELQVSKFPNWLCANRGIRCTSVWWQVARIEYQWSLADQQQCLSRVCQEGNKVDATKCWNQCQGLCISFYR